MTDATPPALARKSISSLGDFADDFNLIAEIETWDQQVYEVPIRKLSLDAWGAVGKEIETPKPPELGAGPKGPVYNYEDPVYLAAKKEAEDQRMYRRILACLRIDVPGKTVEAQVKALRAQLPADVTQALGTYIFQLHNRWRRAVEARADNFHAVRSGEDAGDSEDRQSGVEPVDG